MRFSNLYKYYFNKYFPLTYYYRSIFVRKQIHKNYFNVDKLISEIINLNQPASIIRLGGTEARALGLLIEEKKLVKNWDLLAIILKKLTSKKRLDQLKNNAGLYPVDTSELNFFWETYTNSIQNSDLIGVWGNTFTWSENYFLKNSRTKAIPHMACSPWLVSYKNSQFEPWSKSLKTKKVLIISPFSITFEKQFKNIDLVFPNYDYPIKQAIFLQSPITQGGLSDGLSSRVHFDRTCEMIKNIDFDVALISAGVYATPFANFIKSIGKIGINCGGELQLFFGVLGDRWINSIKHREYFNNYWVRPDINERPHNWKTIENGCYW